MRWEDARRSLMNVVTFVEVANNKVTSDNSILWVTVTTTPCESHITITCDSKMMMSCDSHKTFTCDNHTIMACDSLVTSSMIPTLLAKMIHETKTSLHQPAQLCDLHPRDRSVLQNDDTDG